MSVIDQVIHGSTALVLEVAYAVEQGVMPPLGYDTVANFFRTKPGRQISAHRVLLMVEATKAGLLQQMNREFPDAQRIAQDIIRDTVQNHPDILRTIQIRLSSGNWSLDKALQDQNLAGQAMKKLLSE